MGEVRRKDVEDKKLKNVIVGGAVRTRRLIEDDDKCACDTYCVKVKYGREFLLRLNVVFI